MHGFFHVIIPSFALFFEAFWFGSIIMRNMVSVIGRAWLIQKLYGWRYAPNIGTSKSPVNYVTVLLAVCDVTRDSHDGLTERQYLRGLADLLMTTPDPDIARFIDMYSSGHRIVQNSKVEANDKNDTPALARVLLYDAVRASVCDNYYSQQEQATFRAVAKMLGVRSLQAQTIEMLAVKEAEIMRKKAALLSNTQPR